MLSKISRGIQNQVFKQATKCAAAPNAVRAFSNQHEREQNIEDNQLRSFVNEDQSVTPTESHMQFSKAPIMKNFGELPTGEIPEPLKYNRAFQSTTLSNGIRVVSERNASGSATVGVYVGAGSRQDTVETTGTAHALNMMLTRGTAARTKVDFAQEIEQMGGRASWNTEREWTTQSVTCMKGDVGKAVNILGDVYSSANLDAAEFEQAKQELSAEHENNHKQLQFHTLELAHFNSFRDHMLGQPIKGDRDNVQNLTVEGLNGYRAANYFGDNMVVVGTGGIDHESFVDQCNQAFGTMQKTPTLDSSDEKAIFTPSLMFVRDDEMYNANVAVFYDAPSVNDEDYYSFRLLKNIFGSYRIDKHAEHLNDGKKQYHAQHALLSDLVDVTISDSHFLSYSDCGLFGNYFMGNEVFSRQMNYCGVCLPTIYAHHMNDVEVIRGRNNLYNELMNLQSHDDINAEIGQQMIQTGRRVPRSEVAKRVSHLDAYHMKGLANKWFYDAEPTFTNWGPVETVAVNGSYKYFKVNTISTVSNTHHTLQM